MPDSDPPPGSPAARTPDAGPAADVAAVVARWNPQGAALLKSAGADGGRAPVLLFAPDDPNTALLRTELARHEPQVDFTSPRRTAPPGSAAPLPSGPGAALSSGLDGFPPHGLPADTTRAGSGPLSPDPPLAGPGSTVALILFDAGGALGAATLDLLRRLAAERVRAILAMDGIHAHADWRAVRARALDALAASGLGDLDIIAVSARLASAARAAGDAALMDRSGLTALHAELVAATSVSGDGGGAPGDPVVARVLAETRARITAQVAALRSGTELVRLREERAVLLAGRDGGRATAMSTLRGQLHLARVDLMTEVGAQVRALHVAARTELDRSDPGGFEDYPRRLQQSVVELSGVVDADVDRRLAELVHRVGQDVGELSTPSRRRDPAPRIGPDPEPRHRGVEDHLMIALGASAGVGLGRLLVSPLALVPALDVASIPVTLLLGALVAWWVVRARRQVADRAHLRQWLSEALVNVKAQLEQRVATALVEAETGLAERVVRASTTRSVAVDRRIAELETRIRRAAAEQPAQLAACERDIATIDRLD